MKCLSDYTNAAQRKLFDDLGVFFAFGNKQFNEKAIKCIRYSAVGAGCICPSANVKSLEKGLKKIYQEGIKKDIEENGIDAIIQRELANYECQITGCYEEVLTHLLPYGVTEKQVEEGYKKFYRHCIENDIF